MTATDIIEAWNKQADKFNQWPSLDLNEMVEFAWKCGVAEALSLVDDKATRIERANMYRGRINQAAHGGK
jgi:hypothetical protein